MLESSAPLDVKHTCAPCHDVSWITSHAFHFANITDGPSLMASGAPGSQTPNCLFCHVRHANVASTRAALALGDSQWAATAALVGTEIVTQAADSGPARFEYVKASFQSDGSVSADQLQLAPPSNEACGACHGIVSRHGPSLADWLTRPQLTERTGQIFSPDRVGNSHLNLKDRDLATRAWDVHAERLVNCSDCHFAQNDPRSRSISRAAPQTLRLEPRHAGIGAFLKRPSHDFARGSKDVRCENCHDAMPLHGFLPHVQRHLARLSCEVCHAPKNLVPVLREVDASLPLQAGQPSLRYRGIEGNIADATAFIGGSSPAVIARRDAAGNSKLTPVNFVLTWSWHAGSARGPLVDEAVVNRALFDDHGALRPQLIAALDANHDGQLEPNERRLDTDARLQSAARLLKQAGVSNPTRVGEVKAFAIRHGIVAGRDAIRDCTSCHSPSSRLTTEAVLSEAAAPGSVLIYVGDPAEADLTLVPNAASANAMAHWEDRHRSHYVFGSSRARWVDPTGFSIASLVFLGAIVHGAFRIRAHRRQRSSA